MTFQTNETLFLAGQHLRIRGAMWLVAGSTALEPHRCVLKHKWTSLIAMALYAVGLGTMQVASHTRKRPAMRIVAIHASHDCGWLVHRMPVRLCKLRLHIQVAGAAVGGDFTRSRQADRNRLVHTVTGKAVDVVSRVSGLRPIDAGHLVVVAGSAGGGVFADDVLSFERLGVDAAGAVAGLTGSSLIFWAFPLLVELDGMMPVFREALGNVFVAGSAGLGPDKLFRFRWSGHRRGLALGGGKKCRSQGHRNEHCATSGHGLC